MPAPRLCDSRHRPLPVSHIPSRLLPSRSLPQDKQKREQDNARINNLLIQDHWRVIMRQLKVKELKDEIHILSQNHDKEVDRKDAIITTLDR